MIRRGLIAALGSHTGYGSGTERRRSPGSASFHHHRVGERSGLLATAFDSYRECHPHGGIIWSSNNSTSPKSITNGTVTGVGNGVAIIEARIGPRRGQAAVQVTGGAAAPPPRGPTGGSATAAPPGRIHLPAARR